MVLGEILGVVEDLRLHEREGTEKCLVLRDEEDALVDIIIIVERVDGDDGVILGDHDRLFLVIDHFDAEIIELVELLIDIIARREQVRHPEHAHQDEGREDHEKVIADRRAQRPDLENIVFLGVQRRGDGRDELMQTGQKQSPQTAFVEV